MDGSCEGCGEPGTLMEDPYALNVNDEVVAVILCDGCALERASDA